MRKRFLFLLRFFCALVGLFLLAKLAFMLFNGAASRGFGLVDAAAVLWNGLPLDIAAAGYLTAPAWLCTLASVWTRLPGGRAAYAAYTGLVSLLLAVIFTADTCLYAFWDFKLDSTVFNYLDSPRGAAASVSGGYLAGAFAAIVASACLVFLVLRAVRPRQWPGVRRRWSGSAGLLLAGGLLFLGIRGGIGKSTANVGMAYYSTEQFLNHSAVNPAFSLFSSMSKASDFASTCDFFPEERRAALFASLRCDTSSAAADTLLRTRRPNVLLVIMEGCGGTFVEAVGGTKDVTPNLNRLAREGVLFTRCYATSFRTDRGVLSTLSGYPSFPTTSVMKMPSKSRTLPSLALSLSNAGYHTEFLYGGDVNFTNMKSYLLSTGYSRAYGDTDFPLSTRRTHAWGVTDRIAFDRAFELIEAYGNRQPWHLAFLTLASHEPWKVPYDRLPHDERANAMAYLDDCIGRFTDRLRQTAAWKDLLVIFIPDHGIAWPKGITESNPEKYHIPMIWTGGAVKGPRRVEQICSQSDLAATLLGQMGLPHGDFRFSRDVTSAAYRYPWAVHTWAGGFAFIDGSGFSVYDLKAGKPLAEQPAPSAKRLDRGKAFLQTAYDDLGAR